METITIGSLSYGLVTLPSCPGPSAIRFSMFDAIGVNESPYDLSIETLQWPGADRFSATVTLPPMSVATAAPWQAFLAELRGRLNVFQLVDPSAPQSPRGNARGSSPEVDSTSPNAQWTTTLGTTGWLPNTLKVLRAGDRFQIGYRYHRVVEDVNSDSSGNAQLPIWPSLREQPTAGTKLVLSLPKGLFRLATNVREVNWSPDRAVTFNLACVEAR